MTGNYQLIVVDNLNEPQPKPMAETGLMELPHSWTIIPPQYTLSRHVEVLIATGTTILVVDTKESQDQFLQKGPFTKMTVSPNGKFLALFTAEGKLWVVSADFQKNISEFATKSKIPPQQLVWCGTDSVIMYWNNIVLMVGPFGDWVKFSYDDPIFLSSEIDGVRITSNDKCELLQKVPAATEDIFKIGSTSPAAILFDALDHHEKKSPKADEYIRSIHVELAEAVDSCIDAAGFEFNHHYQRSLLKAASYGKCFLDQYNADRFVDMAQSLRVLNAVRHNKIGIPLTYAQYIRSPESLVDRLIQRHQHLLALRIAEHLNIKTDKILIHWACAKIKISSKDENATCRMIARKLTISRGLPFAQVAKAAYNMGQTRLALKLLEYEPRKADQVPLLISMQEDEASLIKSIESGDTDLVYFVLFHLKRKFDMGEFFRMINNKPLACRLLEVYCMNQDRELLKDFYYQDGRSIESANVTLSEGFDHNDMNERIIKLKIAGKSYQDDKDYAFEAKTVEEAVKLLQLQTRLEKDTYQTFSGLSVSETIYKCTVLGKHGKAFKVKAEFKVNDKRFWWVKLRALVQVRDWEQLEKLAKSKKSPIGYEIGAFKEAGEQAFINKDVEGLRQVRSKCTNHTVVQELDSLLAQLYAK
ncbi:Vps16, C-terminal region-domain-containing protein [Chlamydoabsidia padenii]|nr:Vps16, C-terminal region-domain-containing protein [Chlamydoabsidia padenii]